jgi:hypothetical protein
MHLPHRHDIIKPTALETRRQVTGPTFMAIVHDDTVERAGRPHMKLSFVS